MNTAALLLASGDGARGLANTSGQVGRNYLVHVSTFMMGVDPRRRNETRFQKTLGLNDWYLSGPSNRYPLGNVQMLGKLQGPMVKPARPRVPLALLDAVTARSVDLYLVTEDVPSADSFLTLRSGRIVVGWKPNNLGSHRELVRRVARLVRGAGYPIVLTDRMGIATNSHQCGTAVMGDDPATSVADHDGKAHDLDNLWIADSSLFPSSAAVNPALTIAANALRIAATGALTA